MGLDNGIYLKSNRRNVTRDMVPGAKFPFEKDYQEGAVELCYARKCWGLRGDLIDFVDWDEVSDNDCYFRIYNPSKIVRMIEIVASWMDADKWEDEGQSIWTYDEYKGNLTNWIISLACAMNAMTLNPDFYLEFYDSY